MAGRHCYETLSDADGPVPRLSRARGARDAQSASPHQAGDRARRRRVVARAALGPDRRAGSSSRSRATSPPWSSPSARSSTASRPRSACARSATASATTWTSPPRSFSRSTGTAGSSRSTARAARSSAAPESEIVGHDWFAEFVPEDVAGDVMRRLRAMLAGEPPRATTRYTNPVERPDGSQRTRRVAQLAAARRRTATSTGLLSSGIDVTERTATEEELRFKSFVLDHATDSIIVHDLDGTILYANERAYSSRGFTREEFLALPPFGWVAPEAAETGERAQHELSPQGHAIFESASVTRDGSTVPLEVHATTVTVDGEARRRRRRARHLGAQAGPGDHLAHGLLRLAHGLANRSLFMDRLEHAIANAARDSSQLAADLPGPRPLQEHQRHARPPHRGPAADGRGSPPARTCCARATRSRGSAATSSRSSSRTSRAVTRSSGSSRSCSPASASRSRSARSSS